MGVITDNVDYIFERYEENKDVKSLVIDLIWLVDTYRYGWQVNTATGHIRKRLEEVFN